MQILGSTTKHWHVLAGTPGALPFRDIAFDNSREAAQIFMDVSREMAGIYVSSEPEGINEGHLYSVLAEGGQGVFVDYGPFRIMVLDCDECVRWAMN